MNKGIKATEWLNEVTHDQNIQELDQVENNILNNLRRWFSSRILQPTFNMGYYDTSTKKIVLGTPSATTSFTGQTTDIDGNGDGRFISFDTTSVASVDFTVPANKAWYVLGAAVTNATRNPNPKIEFDDGGGAHTLQIRTGNAAYTQPLEAVFAQPLFAKAADVITLSDAAFVAADNTEYVLWGVEISV